MLNMNSSNCARQLFDPVTELPGDLAAICLCFLPVPTLLGVAQHVNHAWRDAIDGGLPAVWRDVRIEATKPLTDACLAEVVHKSRGRILTIKLHCQNLTAQGPIRSLTHLRVLNVKHTDFPCNESTSNVLSSFSLLEELSVCNGDLDIVFPTLQHLKSVRCKRCKAVKGLHNLVALTRINMVKCSVDAIEPWPATLRDVTIRDHRGFNPHLLDRIAALQQLTSLDTDWEFAVRSRQTSLRQQLSFLASSTTLQRLSFTVDRHVSPLRAYILNYASAVTSLRELIVSCRFYWYTTDQDLQCLGQLTLLESLTLERIRSNKSGTLHHLSSLHNLSALTLNNCHFADGYSSVGLCSKLKRLVIWDGLHSILPAECEAFATLPQLEHLDVTSHFDDGTFFPPICKLPSLRRLKVLNLDIPFDSASLFSDLPLLASSLQEISLGAIKSSDTLHEMVDLLVQLPKLTRIFLHSGTQTCDRLSAEDEARVREACPRLLQLSVFAAEEA